jgi:hypothetical protein
VKKESPIEEQVEAKEEGEEAAVESADE